MELGKQIKKYRGDLKISQEVLAEKVYVSRQTISNWENDKSYPDVHSLLLLSEVFDISIDILIKGDIEEMKEQIKAEDKEQFQKLSLVFTILLMAEIILPVPLIYLFDYVGWAIWGVIAVIALYVGILVEKKKKQFNIQTYREILAFTEGKSMNEIDKAKEEGKRKYQKIFIVTVVCIITIVIAAVMFLILRIFLPI